MAEGFALLGDRHGSRKGQGGMESLSFGVLFGESTVVSSACVICHLF